MIGILVVSAENTSSNFIVFVDSRRIFFLGSNLSVAEHGKVVVDKFNSVGFQIS